VVGARHFEGSDGAFSPSALASTMTLTGLAVNTQLPHFWAPEDLIPEAGTAQSM
jgi:hypothetical protein